MTGWRRAARETVLWGGGVLGVLCLASLAAGWLFNITPLVFASGSMSPAYDAGALGVARTVPAAEVALGDVVSVRDADGRRVTHRVVEFATVPDGRAVLHLQGDANDVPDPQAYVVETVDRVVAGVPHVGYALNAAASPLGIATAVLLALGALALAFAPTPPDGSPRRRLVVPVGAAAAVLVGGMVGASGQAPWASTAAYWTDTATATVHASTPAPTTHQQPGCTSKTSNPGAQRATITWTAVGAQYEYFWAFYREGVVAPLLTGTVGAGLAPPATVTIRDELQIPPGGGGNANYHLTVQTRLVDGHVDVGSPTTTFLVAAPLPGGPNWAVFCRP
ncbi:signal peptidase I [Nocardioides sp. J54]|uniref:signal peptidase I n=1 Tax=Nocardioides sp. J54 TaxID=935866 RepID=UPI0004ADDBA8|nr:signal peptidase I [Nocardioides sp. J54]